MLLQGAALADESFLTGETMPSQKFPTQDVPGAEKKHTLWAGTEVVHVSRPKEKELLGSNKPLAVVEPPPCYPLQFDSAEIEIHFQLAYLSILSGLRVAHCQAWFNTLLGF